MIDIQNLNVKEIFMYILKNNKLIYTIGLAYCVSEHYISVLRSPSTCCQSSMQISNDEETSTTASRSSAVVLFGD